MNLAQRYPHFERQIIADPAVVSDALDRLRVAITLFDSSERLSYANAHFGYLFRSMPDPSRLMGRSYEELVRSEVEGGEIAAESLTPGVEAFVDARLKQLRNNDTRPCDIHLADGRILEIKARRTADNGWVVLWSDATAARHLLGRLEDAMALSAEAFAFFDSEDRLVACNARFAELHGQGIAEALHGIRYDALVQMAAERGLFVTGGRNEEWIARRLQAHQAYAGALTVETADGTAYLVRERKTRDGGRATVFTDVTDTRRIETALAEQTSALHCTRRELAQSTSERQRQENYLADLTRRLDQAQAGADSAKTTLLRTMSHELKTPLNAIIGFSDLLVSMGDRFGPQQIREYAQLIHQGGHTLLRLLTQILDLTKMAAGRFELRPTNVDVAALMLRCGDEYQTAALQKSISLEVKPCEHELAAYADDQALSVMLGHLLDNATTFTPSGGRVCLTAERDGNEIHISVSDNGPGVAQEDLARIVEPFEHARDGGHSHGGGLGLTLTKALAEIQGGRLTVQSEKGKGFTATIAIPAA